MVVNVLVVGLLVVPLGFEHLEGLHEHGLWTHLARIRRLSQTEVGLLHSHACSLFDKVISHKYMVIRILTYLDTEVLG